MGVTKFDNINALTSRAVVGTNANLPTAPENYYNSVPGQENDSVEWRGGELYYTSDNDELHIQTDTSGASDTWRNLDTSFATTSTTSTSTSSSSTTSTTTSTSTSTSTSTTTSTSSTTTS